MNGSVNAAVSCAARRAVATIVVVALHVVTTSTLAAQSLNGRAVRAGVGIEGSVVLLVDAQGATKGRAITREDGRFTVSVSEPGTYRARVLRIGFAPTVAGPFTLRAGATTNADIELTGAPVLLERMTVTGHSECRVRPDSAADAFRVWEAARTALLAASLTRVEPLSMAVTQIDRTLDRGGARIVEEKTTRSTGRSVNPFVSLSPDSAERYGYVTASNDGRVFWGPDADVLLSESFAASHCLRVEGDSARGTLVGVAFAPVASRRDFAEVEGIVWVDRKTAELRALDYRYVNLPMAERARAGGRVEFLRLPAGWWVVERWSIRYPLVATRVRGRDAPVVPGATRTIQTTEELAGVKVAAGEISEVRRGSAVLWERGRVSLAVRVIDAMTGSPTAGILVGEASSGGATATRADGIVRLDHVVPGMLTLSVRSLELEAFGEDALLVPVSVTGEAGQVVSIPLPSARQLFVERCGARALDWGEGLVRGRVDTTTARNGLIVRWRTPYARLGGGPPVLVDAYREVAPDAAGRFALCGVPRDALISIEPLGGRVAAATSQTTPLRFAPNALAVVWPQR